ncbi:MAG: DUF6370 family protein [Fidelibacterota bacterium]
MMTKALITVFTVSLLVLSFLQAQDIMGKEKESTMKIEKQIVEASCGECQFGLEGTSCDLAIRVDGKAYFVDGTHIDDHGDAHADDGFCETIRRAEVSGELRNGRFQVSYFRVLPSQPDSTTNRVP